MKVPLFAIFLILICPFQVFADENLLTQKYLNGNKTEYQQKANQYFECSALYFVAGEQQGEDSLWYDRMGNIAQETLLSSVTYLAMAYKTPEDKAYFTSRQFESDLAQALKEEKQYWRISVKNKTPYMQDTMNVCLGLLKDQNKLEGMIKSFMESEGL